MSNKKPPRYYYFALNLYPSEEKHAEFVKQKLNVFPHIWYGILHDKDTYEEDGVHKEKQTDGSIKEIPYKKGDLKKPHWHIVIKLKQNMTEKSFKDNISFWGIEDNYCEPCDGVNMSLYLDHRTCPEKHQYSPREVFGDTQYYYNIVSKKECENSLLQVIVALEEYRATVQEHSNTFGKVYRIKYTDVISYLAHNNLTSCLQNYASMRYVEQWCKENAQVYEYNPYKDFEYKEKKQ